MSRHMSRALLVIVAAGLTAGALGLSAAHAKGGAAGGNHGLRVTASRIDVKPRITSSPEVRHAIGRKLDCLRRPAPPGYGPC